MITIDGHTFDETLLKGGWVIDAGCRGWKFSKTLQQLGCKVLALDIEKFDDVPDGIEFWHGGLSNVTAYTEAHYFGDGTANFLKGLHGVPSNTPERPCETKPVQLWSLDSIYDSIGCADIDVLKLDVEMSEYQILPNIAFFPRQISVEFHQHVNEELHRKSIDGIIEHLCKYYKCILHIDEARYKYMDCLFIRKDIL